MLDRHRLLGWLAARRLNLSLRRGGSGADMELMPARTECQAAEGVRAVITTATSQSTR